MSLLTSINAIIKYVIFINIKKPEDVKIFNLKNK